MIDKIPKISFILPTWNRAHYLADCLLSLQAQTLDDIEIIVIDDGSTDSTDMLCGYIHQNDKRVKYHYIKHRGCGYARNYGNSLATGEIIATADSDDVYHPSRATITYNYFQRNPEVDAFYGGYLQCDFWLQPQRRHIVEMAEEGHEDRFVHTMSAFRRKVFDKIKYPENREYDVDTGMIEDLIKKGYAIGITNKMLGKIRYSGEGLTAKRLKKC